MAVQVIEMRLSAEDRCIPIAVGELGRWNLSLCVIPYHEFFSPVCQSTESGEGHAHVGHQEHPTPGDRWWRG